MMNGAKQGTRRPLHFGGARSRGFSLVELMVSIAIGLLIIVALMTLFVDVSRSNRDLARTNLQIENGRFALQLLQEDLIHAGYWGPYVPAIDDLYFAGALPLGENKRVAPTAGQLPPDPCLALGAWTPSYLASLVNVAVQASADVPGTCVLANRVGGTDVLVVRHAETCAAGDPLESGGNCLSVAGEVSFQSSQCTDDDVLAASPYILSDQDADFVPPLRLRDCATPAPRRKFVSNIYYIRDFAATGGDGIPTLVRSSFAAGSHQASVALIEGIEGFVVELGIDDRSRTDAAVTWPDAVDFLYLDANAKVKNKDRPTNRGDGVADRTVRCTAASPCSAYDLANAVTAKVYVLARNIEPTPGYNDAKSYTLGTVGGGVEINPADKKYPRHVFSSTVRLHNVSGRRQVP